MSLLFVKLLLPCFVTVSRIMLHIHPVIKVIPLMMSTPPIGLSIPSYLFLPLDNLPFIPPRTAGQIPAAPLIRWVGGGGLRDISAAATRSYTLQNILSGSKSYNYSIFRIRLGPFHCHNHVVKLAPSRISLFLRCFVPFSLPFVLFFLNKIS